MSFERKNLIYVVRHTENKIQEIIHILSSVPQGSAIIYIRSRQLTRDIAKELVENGISATNYHAGLSHAERNARQADWTNDKIRVMVATNAFGMGIDKPNVRLVIHYAAPDTLEAYFQEAGRAGRDGQASYAILLYDKADLTVFPRRVSLNYPPIDFIRNVYESLCYYLEVGIGESEGRTYLFSLEEFCQRFRIFGATANNALSLLSNAGYIEYAPENEFTSRVQVLLHKEELYSLHSSDPLADSVLTAFLRTYTGIFAEAVSIEEVLLAQLTGHTPTEVYLTLKQLAHQQVIRFIPHRSTPTITFTQARVETRRIELPASVYLDRRNDYVRRSQDILRYIQSTDQCRSRMLREYFGEQDVEDCGQCDICLQRHKEGKNSSTPLQRAKERILHLIEDGQPYPISQLNALPFSAETIHCALHELAEESIVIHEDSIEIKP